MAWLPSCQVCNIHHNIQANRHLWGPEGGNCEVQAEALDWKRVGEDYALQASVLCFSSLILQFQKGPVGRSELMWSSALIRSMGTLAMTWPAACPDTSSIAHRVTAFMLVT